MTPTPNYANAGRRVLAAAVVVGMSVPLSISAAMAAPEERASVSAVTEPVQNTERETSTIDPGSSTQDAAPESQAAPTVAAEETVLAEAPEVGGASLESQQSHATALTEGAQAEVVTENAERTEVEQAPRQATQNQQSTESIQPSVEQGEQEGVEQLLMEAESSHHLEAAEQLATSVQSEAASSEKEAPEDTDLTNHEDEAEEDEAEDADLSNHEGEAEEGEAEDADLNTREDSAEEEVDEDESEKAPNFTANGPSLDFRGVMPEADYTIRVGNSEKIYTTDTEGSAAINVIEDFDLPPGAHQVAIVGPDGQEQEITFYATEMQADNTSVNVIGLDPSVTYQLSLDGRIAHVGVFDLTPLPDGTFTLDIHKQFPHAWPGKHAVTLTGGGYNQTIYLRIPLIPPTPDPNPDPEPAPNPNPDPNPDPVPNPNPDPDPVPGPSPDPVPNPNPNPEPSPDVGENLFPAPRPPQQEAEESTEADAEDEAAPSLIASLDTFQAAEAVEANRPSAYEAAELPLAAGDQARHAAPEAPTGSGRYEVRLEAAPAPHAPVPLAEDRNEAQAPRHEPIEQESHRVNPSDSESIAQGVGNLDTDRTGMSGWNIAAWIAGVLALVAAIGLVVFGRKGKTE